MSDSFSENGPGLVADTFAKEITKLKKKKKSCIQFKPM